MNPNDATLPEAFKVSRGEIVSWYNAQRSAKIHAFAQDPEIKVFNQGFALCSSTIRPNSGRHPFGTTCPECERILRFLVARANKDRQTGYRVGLSHGIASAHGLSTA